MNPSNSSATATQSHAGYPGIGTFSWLLTLFCASGIYAYASVCNEFLFFVIALMFIPIISIVAFLFTIVPICLIVVAVRRYRRGQRRAAAAFAIAPVVGLAVLVVSTEAFEWLFLEYDVFVYSRQIEAAEISGKDVHTNDIQINLGPPVTARFGIPQMLWSDDSIVYSEDDRAPLVTSIDKSCGESITPLGWHFYLRRGMC